MVVSFLKTTGLKSESFDRQRYASRSDRPSMTITTLLSSDRRLCDGPVHNPRGFTNAATS
ncbi:MAG: hypothetical protein CMJ23_12385 [Phycisphaerae bacterium]|nr:hypothetical protein [Phycisphaerae bacterium]